MLINANHSTLEKKAEKVEDYVEYADKKMQQAKDKITGLKGAWSGKDQVAFEQQWDKLLDKDSTHVKMMESLKSYAKVLRYAAKEYKQAQIDSHDQARKI